MELAAGVDRAIVVNLTIADQQYQSGVGLGCPCGRDVQRLLRQLQRAAQIRAGDAGECRVHRLDHLDQYIVITGEWQHRVGVGGEDDQRHALAFKLLRQFDEQLLAVVDAAGFDILHSHRR